MHDDLGGTLAAIKIELTRLRNRLGRVKGTDGIADLSERVALLDNLVDQAFSSTRRVSGELRPALLDLGVNCAITWLATEFEERSGIGCVVVLDPPDIHGGEEMVLALARIVQESLTNVSKHAHATQVEITGTLGDGTLELSVRDNGRGFASADLEKDDCSGVRGIRERARALGGEAFILSNASGTVVTVRVPFDATGEFERAYMGSTLPTGASS